jgi:hypothetical protein
MGEGNKSSTLEGLWDDLEEPIQEPDQRVNQNQANNCSSQIRYMPPQKDDPFLRRTGSSSKKVFSREEAPTAVQRRAIQALVHEAEKTTEEIPESLLEQRLKAQDPEIPKSGDFPSEAEDPYIDSFFGDEEIPLIPTKQPPQSSSFKRESSPVFIAVDSETIKSAPGITQTLPQVDLEHLLEEGPIPASSLNFTAPRPEDFLPDITEAVEPLPVNIPKKTPEPVIFGPEFFNIDEPKVEEVIVSEEDDSGDSDDFLDLIELS